MQAQEPEKNEKRLREGRDFTTQTDAPKKTGGVRVEPLDKLERWLIQIAISDQQMCGEAGRLAGDDWMQLPWWRVEIWREIHKGIFQ